MSLQTGQELTPEEVLALKQDSAATNAAVFSATNMGRAVVYGAPEYTPEEIVQMKAATAQAELTPEQVLIDKVGRLYDISAPDPTIDEWRAGTRAEKALQDAGEIDSNFVAAAKGIGGLVVTLAEGATSALRYDPRDAEGNVIPATGALDYISRYNPATMPLAMTDAALRLPATLNYAGELMEQNYATVDAGIRAIGGPKYRVKETGEFVLADAVDNTLEARRGVSPPDIVAQYAAKGLTLVPVTDQDREEFDYQQFLSNRARMRAIEQKRTEEVGAEPVTAAALSLGAAPLDAITGSNYMEQIWKDKLPAESQAMTLQIAADPMNWASLGGGATRLGISAAAKGAGARMLNAIGKGAQAISRPTEASIKQVKNFQNAVWPAGRVALYAGGLAGLNYSNLPEPLKNGMNVAAASYVLYRGAGGVLRWTGKNFPTAGIMLRESADPLGGADKIARHMVANNPKIPASIRERVARPSQFVSMESTPARLARNEALSPRTRKLMDKLSNVYVVQGVRTASDLTTGAVKGGIVAAPFAEASRAAGDEKGADITYGAGIAFGAAGGLANRVAGARSRRVAQAESDIGRMLVDIQAAGPELQKSGGLKRYQWFDRELNRFLTDVELAGGDIGHMFETRSFDEIARTAAMQGLFRNVDYVPLNGADFALNAKAAGQNGAAGFFLQTPEGGRPRIFVNLDARRADVEAHEFGEALFSSGAFSPEQMADMRAAIDKRYGPQGLEARAREYAEQMIKAGNARNFPGENLVVSDEQIRSMMDELSQAELQRGGTDAMDWIRREMMVEEWRMAGLDYAAIRRNVPQGANPLTFAENILGANARALGLSGVKIDPETGLAVKPDQLFKDNPVAADDPIVNRNLRQYIKAHQQWMNDPAHEVPSGVKIAPDGRAESLLNNPNVTFDASGQNPIATRDPLTGQIRWKSDKDRAKEAKLRGQQIRNVAGRNLLEQSNPQFGPKKTANGRIRISGRRLPASLELQNHWKPQLDKIRRIEALSDAAESQQVLYVAMGASADKVKTSRPQDIVAINREVVFDEWVVQGKNNDLYAQFLDLTTIRNRAMKAIAARNPALDPANGGPGYSLKAIMDDVFQWMDDKRAGKAGEATIGQDRKNIVNALINPGTAMNKGKNPLAGSFGRGSAIKTLLADNIMAVSGTGRKGVAMDYNWANGNFMPDQPAPRPDVDSDLNIPNNNRMPQALPREAMGMPDVPANLSTDQILRELEENQGYLGLSTLGMREGRPVRGGAQRTRELLRRNEELNAELRRRGGPQEESDVERILRQRGQAMPDAVEQADIPLNPRARQAAFIGVDGSVRATGRRTHFETNEDLGPDFLAIGAGHVGEDGFFRFGSEMMDNAMGDSPADSMVAAARHNRALYESGRRPAAALELPPGLEGRVRGQAMPDTTDPAQPRRYVSMEKFIKEAGEDLDEVLANAYSDMEVNEDGTWLVGFGDTRNSMYRSRIPVREFFDWLHSDEPMRGMTFEREYKPATAGEGASHTRESYQALIDRLRKISLKPATGRARGQAMPDIAHSPGYQLPAQVPARGHFLVGATTRDGRKLEYKVDPRAVVQPPVKDIGQYKGENVMVLEADRYNTLDGRMGGPLNPWLKSNQVVARTPDGKGYKGVWSNMTSTFVSGARNKAINNTDSGRALIQVMAEDTHRSNRDSVARYMVKVDAAKPNMTQQQIDSLHVLLELGARMGQKAELTPSQKKFVKAMATVKSQATRGKASNAEALFKKAIKEHGRSAWFQEIAAKFANVSFADEAARFTFPQRSSAMDKIDGLPFLPSLQNELSASADFVGAKNLDVVASIQLSQNPDAFAVYFGKNPAEEAKMTATERNLRDQFLANKDFRVHPSYDWMMLGPENADNFILEKPVALESLFPWYRKAHPKASVKNGSPETVAGAMRKYGGIKLKL